VIGHLFLEYTGLIPSSPWWWWWRWWYYDHQFM